MEQLPGFMAEFDRDAVEHKDVSDMASVRDDLIALTVELQGLAHVEVLVNGYDDDPRALYQVPEVRRWFGLIAERWPDLFFWFTPGTLWVYLLSLNPDMHQRLDDGRMQIQLDPDRIFEQAARAYVAADATLSEKGLTEDLIEAITGQAQRNLMSVFQRKQLGSYIVVQPNSRTVLTYRRQP